MCQAALLKTRSPAAAFSSPGCSLSVFFSFLLFPLLSLPPSLPLFLSEGALIIAFVLLSAREGPRRRNTQCFSHLPVIFSPRNGPLHSQELLTLLPGCLLVPNKPTPLPPPCLLHQLNHQDVSSRLVTSSDARLHAARAVGGGEPRPPLLLPRVAFFNPSSTSPGYLLTLHLPQRGLNGEGHVLAPEWRPGTVSL